MDDHQNPMYGSLTMEFVTDTCIPVHFPPNGQILKLIVADMILDSNSVFMN
jgi:hypothetical protein